MTIINAHFDGKVLVPDEPLDLRAGEAVELSIHRQHESANGAQELLAKLPLIHVSPEDAEAVNRDPEFDIEES